MTKATINKETGFLDINRVDVTYRPVDERKKDYKDVTIRISDEDLKSQAARCMDCGVPFCHTAASGCSLRNIIPEFNALAYRGKWKEALDILLSTNPFPEFTGRICPAPCEGSCVLGLIKPQVNICKIELAIIEEGFKRGYVKAEPPETRRSESVAIIGSGPAGLAAAQILNRAGVNVTVFENAEEPGGLLRYGIPDFKLEKWIIHRRIDLMKEEGVKFECGVCIGKDISFRYLNNRFQSIVLAGGSLQPRDIPIKGRELSGIHFAMDFLTQQNQLVSEQALTYPRISAKDKNVLVIGGGDTGSDCIGTSWRQGAKSVVQLEIMPEPPPERSESTPWPMWPLKRRDSSSHKEGCKRIWNTSAIEFIGKDGNVKTAKCANFEWKTPKDGNRPIPEQIKNSEYEIEADLVLLALGFVGPGNDAMIDDLGIEKDPRGFIKSNDQNMTNLPGIFVAGDMMRGPSLVVHALANGRNTGQDVLNYLDNL